VDGDDLEEEFLADEAARDGFALFWEAMVELEVEAVVTFRSETQGPLFLPALHGSLRSLVSSSSNQ